MSKNLPKKLKIGRGEYEVRHIAKKTSVADIKDYGECDFEKQLITMWGRQPTKELADTLIHEALHGMIRTNNIKFRSSREEEKYVRHFTGIVITLLQDNPELLKYLGSMLHK